MARWAPITGPPRCLAVKPTSACKATSYGTFTAGRQYDPLVDQVQGMTEDNYFGSTFATAGDVDNYDDSSRTNNSLKYVSPVFERSASRRSLRAGRDGGFDRLGQTWSLAAAYNNGPLALSAGYFVADNAEATTTSNRLVVDLGRHVRWSGQLRLRDG